MMGQYAWPNLLAPGAVKDFRLEPGFEWPGYYEPKNWTQRVKCVPGKTYTLSIITDVAGEVCFGFYLADGSIVRPKGYELFDAGESVVRTLTAPAGAKYVAASWADGNRRPMLVKGRSKYAWAPAEGEELAGGGASMSANLLDGVTPTLVSGTTESDGVWHCPAQDGKHDSLMWNLPGMPALATNQTLHLGLSAKGTSADASGLHMVVAYRDSAGNRNWAWSDAMPVGTEWSRAEGTVTIPSGMTMTALTAATSSSSKLPEVWLTSATLSYGSPVTLTSDAHTPYATQDHVAAEYATKAALKAAATHTHAIADVDGLQAALDSKANAAAVTPIANGGTGATTKDDARKNLGIATVADVAWTDLWKDTGGHYVRWACRNNVVYVQWKVPQTTTAQWLAGILPAGYRPSGGTATVAAWTEGNRMATGWVDVYGDVYLKANSAQTDGTNQGSLSYPIF